MIRRSLGLLAVAAFLAACGNGAQHEAAPASDAASPALDQAVLAQFRPLPDVISSPANPITPEKVALGRMLYYDTRFSSTGDVSCYVCHPLHDYGTSHRARGVGRAHMEGGRNEPTVYNAAGHIAQFWDGRAPDVEAQALGPVLNPVEMGMPDGSAVVAVLRRIPGYGAAFRAAFPGQADPITFENFGRAIGAFERGLVTPARWDGYLKGDAAALSAAEREGLRTFVATGCAQCHTGAYLGGGLYRKVGLANAWYSDADAGRFSVTNDPLDRQVFKVPSLRNVEETWPYFHDGSVQRIQDAVRLMAWHQLGTRLSEAQVQSIVAWLGSLTGPVPHDYIQEPLLPPTVAMGERLTIR